MPSVAVLVLNYNGEPFIEACLKSVLAQDHDLREVLVIDNGSTDRSAEIVKRDFPGVRLLETGANLGFAAGMNLGIDRTDAELLLLLNTDVVLAPAFVRGLVDALADRSDVGSAAGKVYRLGEGSGTIIDTTGHVIFKNRLFIDRGDGEVDVGQYDKQEEIFGPCAGIGMYRRSMLDDIKIDNEYFDASFFLFLEDTDLNWRAQLRGWKSVYVPWAHAWHVRGGVAVRRSRVVELHNYKNRYMMLIKNDTPLSALMNLHHFLITDSLKSFGVLWRSPGALLGWLDVWRNLPSLLRKRRIIQRSRKVSPADFEQWFARFDYGRWIRHHLRG